MVAAVDPPVGVAAVAEPPRDNPLRNPAADRPLRDRPAGDPFGLRGAPGENPVRPATAEEPANSNTAPDAAAQAARPPLARKNSDYPSAAPALGPDRNGGPSSAGNRSAPARTELYPGQEPARFRADPAAQPTDVSRPAAPVRVESRVQSQVVPSSDGPATMNEVTAGDGVGQPGAKHLEGIQSPQLSIQKFAPPEIQVGRPAVFRVTVRNTGQTAAGNVEVRDQVPKGTRLMGSRPRANQGQRGELVWSLGTIKPGEESTVEMQLMPTAEGEIGSVATVKFDADATARSIATRPKLVLQTTGAGRVLIGEEATLTFTVSNPGSGVATGVVLEEHIPAGLQHPAGSELEYPVGDLKPGESRKLELKLRAGKAGALTNVAGARGDGSLRAEHRFDLEVVAPQLDVAVNGPKRRYLDREASYQLSISNPGTAPAQQVELVAYLPPGMKYVSANNAGHYDEPSRAVYWRLEELPPNEKGTVELVTMPVEQGQHSIKVRGAAQKLQAIEKEQPVVVEGIAAVLFQLAVGRNPIEVGGETSYEIRVVNQGSKAATNVRVTALLPQELKPLSAEGPTRNVVDGNRVQFEALTNLAPKAEAVFKLRVQGLQAGDLRMRCQLMTDEMQTPVTKEESTRVYADE
jgi:uncharacterized repeat protein (TIGR01451 family)